MAIPWVEVGGAGCVKADKLRLLVVSNYCLYWSPVHEGYDELGLH